MEGFVICDCVRTTKDSFDFGDDGDEVVAREGLPFLDWGIVFRMRGVATSFRETFS